MLAVLVAVFYIFRSDSPAKQKDAAADDDGVYASLINAIRYLATGRRWRYSVPWFLVVGPEGAGKSSLANSLRTDDRQDKLLKRRGAALDDPDTFVFDQGVLIELPGEEEAEQERFLARIARRRPERPLDGVLLVLPASDLLAKDGSAEKDGAILRVLAETVFGQLFKLQKAVGFTLPVYVVVSQCDRVHGFDAFWTQISEVRRCEIVGWSHSGDPQDRFDETWIGSVRATLVNKFDSLRLRMTTSRDPERVRKRFSFPGTNPGVARSIEVRSVPRFRCVSVSVWIPATRRLLRRRRWRKGYANRQTARGRFLCQRSRLAKGVRERNLGTPLDRGLWSRDPWTKRSQVALVAAFALTVGWSFAKGFDLYQQVQSPQGVSQGIGNDYGPVAACVAQR